MIAADVLDFLAQDQNSLNWLANDGRQHLVDARLSVFRSDQHFAVFTEFPYFDYRAFEFDDWLGCAGNCLIPGAYDWQYRTPRPSLFEEVPTKAFWNSHNCRWLADRAEFSVVVKGERHDFAPTNEDYERSGIVFEDDRAGVASLKPGQMLRFLCVALDHPFFLSERELRTLIQPQVEPQMSLFLQTNHWQHPEPILGCAWDDQLIDNIPCWQVLARASASGDLTEWNTQDTSAFNTNWKSLERIYHEGDDGYYNSL